MPIYAYRCAACGYAKDVLQKLTDPPPTVCPACGAERFQKQVTAAGFQLKGSGWYATDFKNGAKPKTEAAPAAKADAGSEPKADAKPASEPAAAPAPSAPAAAPPPAAAT